jgi:DNA-binding GntR family transcriptional regulator
MNPTGPPSPTVVRIDLKTQVVRVIRNQIFAGELGAGEQIDHDLIAGSLGVSKRPVREALIVLEQEGLVYSIQRSGTYVAELTAADIRDHYQVYALAGGLAARKAVEALSESDLAVLAELASDLDGQNDPRRAYDLAFQFFRTVYRAGASARLLRQLRKLARTVPAWLFEYPADSSAPSPHGALDVLAALRDRDSELVDSLVQAIIVDSGDRVITRLEQSGFWAVPRRAEQQ